MSKLIRFLRRRVSIPRNMVVRHSLPMPVNARAIIPGDDPGDQQPPERRGLYPDPDAVAANARLRK